MTAVLAILKRELRGYFGTPVAYVFLVVFLALAAFLTLVQERWFDARNADLRVFFDWMPWLFALFAPAIAMRMWAEERRSGTVELLLTLPVTVPQAVVGKFLAGWVFFVIALTLSTLPMVVTVSYLGSPDYGPVFTGFVGSALMAAGYLAIGTFFSTLTKNQVIAFILGTLGCFVFVIAGHPSFQNALGAFGIGTSFFGALSFTTLFDGMKRGVLEFGAVFSLLVLTAAFLVISCISLDERKAQ
jgi:ABC-2 type transport system permease protein